MQEAMIVAIGSLSVIGLCLLGLLVRERERAAGERRGWARERARLLDRIMAVDYTRFCLSTPGQQTPEAAVEEEYDPLEDDGIAGTVQHIPAE
ncbi:MAG: hypothetical protein JRG73_18180 [Deltaproteobacteria bacterium]|nr:hypothetical protein [Deltaproteobacteria bacterium]MBW2308855.1 hypothetical protein [Deltaproteobacteria bacterium]